MQKYIYLFYFSRRQIIFANFSHFQDTIFICLKFDFFFLINFTKISLCQELGNEIWQGRKSKKIDK